MTRTRLTLTMLLLIAAAARAGEWKLPPRELLSPQGVKALAGKTEAALTPVERLFRCACEYAEVRWLVKDGGPSRFRLLNADERRRKQIALARRAYLLARRSEAVWVLLFLEQHVGPHQWRSPYLGILFEVADESCVEVLRHALKTPEAPVGIAARLLAYISPKGRLGELLDAARTCPASQLKDLVFAIGKFDDPRADAFLCKMAVEAGDAARTKALELLTYRKSREVAATLQRISRMSGFRYNPRLVELGLKKNGLPVPPRGRTPWEPPKPDPAAIPTLIRDLTGPDKRKALNAQKALCKAGPPVIPHILPLAEDPVVRIRCTALSILASTRDPRVLPGVKRGLDHVLPQVRATAAWALKGFARPEALPLLKQAARDRYWRVREAAVRGLGSVRSPEAVAELVRLLSDKGYGVAVEAGLALVRIDLPEARAALDDLFAKGPPRVVTRMLWRASLGWVKTCRPQVRRALRHPDAEVRRVAADRFARLMRDKDSVPMLVDLLDDPDAKVRQAAAKALSSIAERRPPKDADEQAIRWFWKAYLDEQRKD